MSKELTLLRSEAKKAIAAAKKINTHAATVSGWYTDGVIDYLDFATFEVEVCDKDYNFISRVIVSAYLPDRRRSFTILV